MNIMPLPALQETLEQLSAATRTRSGAVARAADVVSFPMAKIVSLVDEAVQREDTKRRLLVEVNRSLAKALEHPDELKADDFDAHADILVQMKRALRDFARPLFSDGGGDSLESLAELLRSHPLPQPADRRLARRQAERIEEFVESCETQRLEFLTLTEQSVTLMETAMMGNETFRFALKKAIGRQSIERYPIVNEYLAK